MMRSSPAAGVATRSSVAATVVRRRSGVNSRLTQLSTEAERLFARYRYPDWLLTHSRVVGRIAEAFVAALRIAADPADAQAVVLAGYLHDIGRSPLLAGDPREHNVLSALVLAAEGLERCVEPARRHAIHTVLDPALAPRTLSDKLVYVADRRGGQTVEPLEERARDTARRYPDHASDIERAIPLARALEREVFVALTFEPDELTERIS